MLYVKVSLIAVFAVAAVHAARYCQCENRDASRIFPGIQAICSQLPNSWCSTNCNIWGGNCDYCQYTPAGDLPDADYTALKNWCSKQSIIDNQRKQVYYGIELSCYTFQTKTSCATCGGCKYSSTSTSKRLTIRQDDGNSSASDLNPAPNATTILQQTLLGVKVGGWECSPVFPLASQIIAQEFVDINSGCSIVYPDSNKVQINCGFLEDLPTGYQLFEDLCYSFGGHSGAVDWNGDVVNPHYPNGPDN